MGPSLSSFVSATVLGLALERVIFEPNPNFGSAARGLHALLVALLLPVRGGGWLSRTPVDCSPRVVAGALRQHHWGSLGTLRRFSTQQFDL